MLLLQDLLDFLFFIKRVYTCCLRRILEEIFVTCHFVFLFTDINQDNYIQISVFCKFLDKKSKFVYTYFQKNKKLNNSKDIQSFLYFFNSCYNYSAASLLSFFSEVTWEMNSETDFSYCFLLLNSLTETLEAASSFSPTIKI